jgi:hypothetical protein
VTFQSVSPTRSEIQTYPPVKMRPARGPLKMSVLTRLREGFASVTHITDVSALGSHVLGFGIPVADGATDKWLSSAGDRVAATRFAARAAKAVAIRTPFTPAEPYADPVIFPEREKVLSRCHQSSPTGEKERDAFHALSRLDSRCG